jgi:hypothetical protein
MWSTWPGEVSQGYVMEHFAAMGTLWDITEHASEFACPGARELERPPAGKPALKS